MESGNDTHPKFIIIKEKLSKEKKQFPSELTNTSLE